MEIPTIDPIEPAARGNLIRLAEAWCAATGNSILTAGRYAHGDPPFFKDLIARHKKWMRDCKPDRIEGDRKGSVTFRVYDKILAWFTSNWPPDAAFPTLDDIFHNQKGTTNGKERKVRSEKAPQTARAEQGESGAAAGSSSAALARLRNL